MYKNEKNIFLLLWFLILISINSYAIDFISSYKPGYNLSLKNIYFLIELIRFIIPFLIFIYLGCLFFFVKKKFDRFTFFFFIYAIWQLIIGNILNAKGIKINDYQITISLICVLLIFYLSYVKNYNDLYIKFLYIFITFISCIGFYFAINIYNEFISRPDLYYFYVTKTLGIEGSTFGQPNPRITGLSRILVIIFYFIFYYTLLKKNKISYKIFFICTLFFLNLSIYASQTRMGLVGIFMILIVYILFIKESLFKKYSMIVLIFILPIVSFELAIKIKAFSLSKESNYDLSSLHKVIEGQNRNFSINNGSSGRTTIWSLSLNIIYDKKLIFGNGPQSDRILLGEFYKNSPVDLSEKMKFGTNSSNAIIYSILCGGIISLFYLMQIYRLIFSKLINFFFKMKKEQKNFLKYFLMTSLCFLIFRSIFENSFALFGVDFCLLCLCYYMLNLKKLNSSKSI
jgi:oligosaccharide repeat unit polymerase